MPKVLIENLPGKLVLCPNLARRRKRLRQIKRCGCHIERLPLRCRENSQGKVIPPIRCQCDMPYGTYPFNCLLKGTVFALHEIVSHKEAGSVLARGAMNEDWNASADVLFGERECCRKNAKTMLKIALLWRCII